MISLIWKLSTSDRKGWLRESIHAAKELGAPIEAIVLKPPDISVATGDIIETVADERLTVARNRGVKLATNEYVAWMDSDAYPTSGWAREALEGFTHADMVGGPLIPDWQAQPAEWLPKEFHWLIGCGPYYETVQTVPNTYGSNLAVRKTAFEDVGGFDESLGMGADGPGQGAETELVTRLRDAGYDGVQYRPQMQVKHKIPAGRTHSVSLAKRAYNQGMAKAQIGTGGREQKFITDELLPALKRQPLTTTALTTCVGAGYLRGQL